MIHKLDVQLLTHGNGENVCENHHRCYDLITGCKTEEEEEEEEKEEGEEEEEDKVKPTRNT